MLMFEKISSLESELETKDAALEDITSKYNLNNMNVKTLSERIREVTFYNLSSVCEILMRGMTDYTLCCNNYAHTKLCSDD